MHLPRRVIKIIAIIVVGCAIAFSTVIFQTVTNNKILTPSILGLDSMYMLIQTGVIFLFGSTHIMIVNKNLNFLITLGGYAYFRQPAVQVHVQAKSKYLLPVADRYHLRNIIRQYVFIHAGID